MAMFTESYIYFPHEKITSTIDSDRQNLFLVSNNIDYKMGLRILDLYSWSYEGLKSTKISTLQKKFAP